MVRCVPVPNTHYILTETYAKYCTTYIVAIVKLVTYQGQNLEGKQATGVNNTAKAIPQDISIQISIMPTLTGYCSIRVVKKLKQAN